jgi:curli biogenesis system outer membrane secretion channel CsgG
VVLNISAVLLFGAASALAVKTKSAGGGAAIVLFLFGFFAAGTGAYEPIRNLVQASADAIAQLGH